jgi:hypothetical protein
MDFSDGNLDEPIGEAVENICRDADAHIIVCHQSIIDAAFIMSNRQLNDWIYLAFREDGTTIWRAPDESGIAVVSKEGDINITQL